MSTQVQQEATTVVNQPHNPTLINTAWGDVAVYGHENVSQKELEILWKCLNIQEFSATEGDHGVRTVVFRNDGYPVKDGKPILASASIDVGGIAINMSETFNMSVIDCIDNPEVSIKASYHRNMILNFLHEILHISMNNKETPVGDKLKEEEELAKEWSLKKLFELAKTENIEPDYTTSPFLAKECVELLNTDDEWTKKQKHMMENNIMYKLEEGKDVKGFETNSFKVYVHLLSGDDPDDASWKTTPAATPGLSDIIKPAEAPPSQPTVTNANTTVAPPDETWAEMLDDPQMPAQQFVPFGGPQQTFGQSAMPTQQTPMFPTAGGAPMQQTPLFNQQAAPMQQPQTPMFPVAGAQQMPAIPQQQVAVYPQNGIDPATMARIMTGVYNKVYTYIFQNCGRMLNSDVAFQNPEAVCIGTIPLTEEEKYVVVKMDCLDENGRWCPNMYAANGLKGFIMKNAKLPAYKLYLNFNGMEVVRLLLPQNTAKRGSNGQYTEPAAAARAGACIMYIMEGNESSGGKKFLFKVINGVMEQC